MKTLFSVIRSAARPAPYALAAFATAFSTLSVSPSQALADSTQTAALSWLPPSTSYLPLYRGPLVRFKGNGPASDVESLLAPSVVEGSYGTVADRFDFIRANVLGHTTPVKEQMSQLTYRPEYSLLSGAWRGYCNQWSAWTTSDGELVKEVNKASDLVCGGTYLSVGEIKELITLFYPDSPVDGDHEFPSFTGFRYSRPLDSTVLLARNHLGTDSLYANSFDSQVFGQLSKDKGLVMNLSSPGQIWNYPVFRAESQNHDLEISDLSETLPLPAKLYVASSPQARQLLEAYDLTYQALDTYTLMLDGKEQTDYVDPATRKLVHSQLLNDNFIAKNLADRARLVPLVYAKASELGKPQFLYRTLNSEPAQGLSQLLDLLYADLVQLANRGEISLNSKYSVVRKNTRVYYGKESPFASERTEINFREKTFSYVIFEPKDHSSYREGVWITPSKERPGFIWIADSHRNFKSKNPYAGIDSLQIKGYNGLAEIWTLLNSCTGVEEVRTFFKALNQVNDLSSREGQALKAQYAKLKPILNSSAIERANPKIAQALLNK